MVKSLVPLLLKAEPPRLFLMRNLVTGKILSMSNSKNDPIPSRPSLPSKKLDFGSSSTSSTFKKIWLALRAAVLDSLDCRSFTGISPECTESKLFVELVPFFQAYHWHGLD